jgi:hypothetical protein
MMASGLRHAPKGAKKKQATVGIGVSNNVVASVKRRSRLGIIGPKKPGRVTKRTYEGRTIFRDERVIDGRHYEVRLHATKGYRAERIWK